MELRAAWHKVILIALTEVVIQSAFNASSVSFRGSVTASCSSMRQLDAMACDVIRSKKIHQRALFIIVGILVAEAARPIEEQLVKTALSNISNSTHSLGRTAARI